MAIELKIPSVGESVSEVQVGEWQFAVGDFVEEDETVVVIETDKVNVDLPAPASGTLKEIVKEEGDDAEVGDVVGYLEEGEAEESEPSEEEKKEAPEEKEEEKAEEKEKEEKGEEEEKAGKVADEKEADKKKDEGEVRVMPAARRLLEEHGLSVSDVEATGPGGRLLKEDVLRHLEEEDAAAEAPQSVEREAEPSRADAGRAEERQRMTPLRRKVASRLVQAQEEAALLTTFNEIDMSAVMELRKKYKAEFQERYDIKLGFMSFFVKATVEALKEIPQVNAEIDGEEIVFKNYQDIGVAVGGGKGLVVPILRNAERMSFAEVEEKIADLASRAQEGKLELSELEGGTFTISNGGVYGSLLSTPIVNPPQSGILGLHKIEERPVAVDGEVMIRPMMYVALTYDHRIVDGREAVTFLVKIKERIEDPSRILLEV